MAESAVINIDADSDTQDGSRDHSAQSSRKVSSMYATWHFENAGKRDKTHSGAQCLPCKCWAALKGTAVASGGTCLAELPAILTHVKGCTLHDKADRVRAETELVCWHASI